MRLFFDLITESPCPPSAPFPRRPLVGEASAGKASRSLAQHIPGQVGMEGMKAAATGVVGDLARARIALDERGQRLGELEDRTAQMMTSAETFSKHAHEVRRGGGDRGGATGRSRVMTVYTYTYA